MFRLFAYLRPPVAVDSRLVQIDQPREMTPGKANADGFARHNAERGV